MIGRKKPGCHEKGKGLVPSNEGSPSDGEDPSFQLETLNVVRRTTGWPSGPGFCEIDPTFTSVIVVVSLVTVAKAKPWALVSMKSRPGLARSVAKKLASQGLPE